MTTIDALRVMLKDWLRNNGGRKDCVIDSFYIGKAEKTIEGRRADHAAEGYSDTLEIAFGSAATIKSAEKALITYFMNSKEFKEKCDNKAPWPDGNKKANKLYVAYRAHTTDDNKVLEEGGLTWPESYHVIGGTILGRITSHLSERIPRQSLADLKRMTKGNANK